jgi:hypothetical protein
LILPFLLLAASHPAVVVARMPLDVRRFIERRQSCDHWAGEEPYDRDRARQIDSALRRDRCDTIDRTEVRLRRRHARRRDIIRAIEAARDGD